jgi:hypothetical protein
MMARRQASPAGASSSASSSSPFGPPSCADIPMPSMQLPNQARDLPMPSMQLPNHGRGQPFAVQNGHAHNGRVHLRTFVEEGAESPSEPDSEIGDETEIVVGPTHLSVSPMRLSDQWLPETSRGSESEPSCAMPVRSGPRSIAFQDIRRLSEARSADAPLSFGSVLHLAHGTNPYCRPCMFERWPGRCNKSWLCDFCHLHVRQKSRPRGILTRMEASHAHTR